MSHVDGLLLSDQHHPEGNIREDLRKDPANKPEHDTGTEVIILR